MIGEIFKHSPLYRIGGDEFVAILQNQDYASRKDLMLKLHNTSVEHISSNKVVVSGGISEFKAGEDFSFHDVFQRADELMYTEKKLLKGLGSISREENKEETVQENVSILDLKRQVLIVEDEPINQALLGNILHENYELLYAGDGVEALDIIRENKGDLTLVLLDLMLPKMNGVDVLKSLKGDSELKKIPVIVLTADHEAEIECLRIGAADFIPKPYPDPEIIRARVDRCIEISENRDTIEQTERDPLTKLYNIDYFDRYVNMYDRHYEDMKMDAIVVDINRFHVVNERYGKQFGDLVLQKLGQRIRNLARKIGGVGGRRSGDTFLLYCPHREDYEECLDELSNNLLDDVDTNNRVNLRMGIYSDADKELDIAQRFDRAKEAADNVKNSMQRIGFYDKELHESDLYKEKLLEDFQGSIENNDFQVYFQPKFDIRPEKPILASAEALVRWKHPDLGMISPGIFIPLLEDSGRIYDLDIYVWEKVAERISYWKKEYNFSVPVSVNVSRIDMLMPNLKETFLEILDKYNLTADDIILEITESAYTGDTEQVISTAKELRGVGMGFRIEMDDFGTGYSSLGMLAKLPIDALKLDMTFVRSSFGENKDVRMIELIIDIADYLHIPVVAEGVETIEQMTTLKALGCDLVQGYYFSKPLPPEEFDRFLIERREQSVETKSDQNRSYISIAKALTGDYEDIYYIDVLSDYYLRFYSGPNLELKIASGDDGFLTELNKLLEKVNEEDREKLKQVLSKENLKKCLDNEEDVSILFNVIKDDKLIPYRLQSVRTRNNDTQHIVIGIRQEQH
jgi:diguanylate cyclase (GGDEF)-like protein